MRLTKNICICMFTLPYIRICTHIYAPLHISMHSCGVVEQKHILVQAIEALNPTQPLSKPPTSLCISACVWLALFGRCMYELWNRNVNTCLSAALQSIYTVSLASFWHSLLALVVSSFLHLCLLFN